MAYVEAPVNLKKVLSTCQVLDVALSLVLDTARGTVSPSAADRDGVVP